MDEADLVRCLDDLDDLLEPRGVGRRTLRAGLRRSAASPTCHEARSGASGQYDLGAST